MAEAASWPPGCATVTRAGCGLTRGRMVLKTISSPELFLDQAPRFEKHGVAGRVPGNLRRPGACHVADGQPSSRVGSRPTLGAQAGSGFGWWRAKHFGVHWRPRSHDLIGKSVLMADEAAHRPPGHGSKRHLIAGQQGEVRQPALAGTRGRRGSLHPISTAALQRRYLRYRWATLGLGLTWRRCQGARQHESHAPATCAPSANTKQAASRL